MPRLLASASDVRYADFELVTRMFAGAMIGPTRALLAGDVPARILRALPAQLGSLCLGQAK
ncbi:MULTISPECIES: hypothetical protein [unclassified Variovorax]|uniref:hypothetical protein n=1 Tax=unclassified Variovorax TaxID=663243 RepID=UPI0032E631A4